MPLSKVEMHMEFSRNRLGRNGVSAFAFAIVLMTSLAGIAQERVPRFERSECPFDPPRWTGGLRAECGYLFVPEVRGNPNGRVLRLAVAIYRATERASAPPLLLLHGGPGGGGGIRTPWPFFRSFLARNRDIVIYDLRGAGLSEPQLCPGFYENTSPVFNRRFRQKREQGYNEAVRACAASLKAQGIEPSAYSTAINAADAIDLRKALGYTAWDIYGVSYGGQLAQELMRRDPAGTHAVVLMIPGVIGGPVEALTEQRALERVISACAAQPACRTAFPTLQDDFYAVYDELSRRPMEVLLEGDNSPITVWLDGERFLREIPHEFVSDRAAVLPWIINELRRGDRAGAARRLLGAGMMAPWFPLGHLVDCNDAGADYPAVVSASKQKLRPAFQMVADDIREHCEGWVLRPARNKRKNFVTDIPTLVLNGEIDSHGTDLRTQKLAAALKHAYVYEVRGRGHESLGSCADSVVEQFIADPTRAPDASCLANIQQIAFVTQEPESPTLVFIITPDAGVQTPFAGEWKAALPAGAVVDLKTNGITLTGTIRPKTAGPEPIVIFDGRVNGNTVTFKFKSPDGQRTITLIGTLTGDQIMFRREVEVYGPPGRPRPGLFGNAGPRTFTASRTTKRTPEK
jgi:pimeloyl-ACP methyl ester carboxylesterase